MSVYRSAWIFVALVCLSFMGGCQSSGTTAPAAAAAPSAETSKAVLVTTGNGSSVLYMTSTDGSIHALSTEGAPTCNQCEADAAAYFKTGHIDPVCAVCGAHRTALLSVTGSGHQ